MPDRIKAIIDALVKGFDDQRESQHSSPYVDVDNPSDSCLDGWFNLVDIAVRISDAIDVLDTREICSIQNSDTK